MCFILSPISIIPNGLFRLTDIDFIIVSMASPPLQWLKHIANQFHFIFVTSRKYIRKIMVHIYYSLITLRNLSWVFRIQQYLNQASYFCFDKIRSNWICVSYSYVHFFVNCAHFESQLRACWANENGIESTEDKPWFEFPLYQ